MEFNIKIAQILDRHLPSDGIGTEREKLRIALMNDLLTLDSNTISKIEVVKRNIPLSAIMPPMFSTLEAVQNELSSAANKHLELQVVEGLKLKGYEFDDELELRKFIGANCARVDDVHNKRYIYYVSGQPFLKHEYSGVDLSDLFKDPNTLKIKFGSFVFV